MPVSSLETFTISRYGLVLSESRLSSLEPFTISRYGLVLPESSELESTRIPYAFAQESLRVRTKKNIHIATLSYVRITRRRPITKWPIRTIMFRDQQVRILSIPTPIHNLLRYADWSYSGPYLEMVNVSRDETGTV